MVAGVAFREVGLVSAENVAGPGLRSLTPPYPGLGARDRPVYPLPCPSKVRRGGASFSGSVLSGEALLQPATPLLHTLPRASAGEDER